MSTLLIKSVLQTVYSWSRHIFLRQSVNKFTIQKPRVFVQSTDLHFFLQLQTVTLCDNMRIRN